MVAMAGLGGLVVVAALALNALLLWRGRLALSTALKGPRPVAVPVLAPTGEDNVIRLDTHRRGRGDGFRPAGRVALAA
jgi:hypothetical protein